MAACWSWHAGGAWIDYEPQIAADIEAARTRNAPVELQIGANRYVIDPVAMTQTNLASGSKREIRRVEAAAGAPLAPLLPEPIGAGAADAHADAEAPAPAATLQDLHDKVQYVSVRIERAATANQRMACFLLLSSIVSFICFIVASANGANSEECHCEKGGVGYYEIRGDRGCEEDAVEVCNLEVEKVMMWTTIAAVFLALTCTATLSNPPRFWLLRELRLLEAVAQKAIEAQKRTGGGSDAAFALEKFNKRGNQVIDACDRRVRVDKWSCASVRADWCAFLVQGWVTYSVTMKIRALHKVSSKLQL
eukprot:TRINITY_DN91248_c0_g1_i1.p1 TRINITY_DN91248_c0_g1~~TRINITY_DN91248_c0_g1_i1.p1  ORF type:complete len:307 (+),score=48.63 TRINITY_DN91248_c0_g1_i1:81-1001(+)